jgi:GxxExxY protein
MNSFAPKRKWSTVEGITKATEVPEKDELTQRVIGAAMEVHRLLGPGLLESIYEEALCHELALRGMQCERQKPIVVYYKDIAIQGQRLDLLVNEQLVIELKSVSALPEVAMAQVLSYLHATGLKRALLFNFGERLLKNGIKRISL